MIAAPGLGSIERGVRGAKVRRALEGHRAATIRVRGLDRRTSHTIREKIAV